MAWINDMGANGEILRSTYETLIFVPKMTTKDGVMPSHFIVVNSLEEEQESIK